MKNIDHDDMFVEANNVGINQQQLFLNVNEIIENRNNDGVQLAVTLSTNIGRDKKRWLMLFVFCYLSLTSATTWIAFAPISSKVQKFYNVSSFAINSMSMVFMLVYFPGAIFSAYYVAANGLRNGLLIASFLNFIGAVIRIFPFPFSSVENDPFSFGFVAIGQTILAIAQLFILPIPPVLGQAWFGADERGQATAIGVLSIQLGIAVGFYLPPAIVFSEKKIDNENGNEMESVNSRSVSELMIVEALMCGVAWILVIFFFESRPSLPASLSAVEMEPMRIKEFGKMTLELFRKWSFVLMLVTFGIGVGAFYAISTLLEQIVSPKGYTSYDAGNMGIAIVLIGLLGAYAYGYLTDKTKQYKYLLVSAYGGTAVSVMWFIIALKPNNIVELLLVCSVMGFFMTGMLPLGMDLAVEVTYPIPDMVSSTAMMASAQVFGIIFVNTMDAVDDGDGMKGALFFLTIILFITTFAFLFFKADHARSLTEERMNMTLETPSRADSSLEENAYSHGNVSDISIASKLSIMFKHQNNGISYNTYNDDVGPHGNFVSAGISNDSDNVSHDCDYNNGDGSAIEYDEKDRLKDDL